MSTRLKPGLSLLLPLFSVAAGLMLYLWEPLSLGVLRNAVFDQYQRWHPRIYEDVPVRIVDIDEESLQRLGQWPWPRTRLAELVQRLRAAGTAAVGFDVVFAEPDRTTPAIMLENWALTEPLKAALRKLPDHDQALAAALAPGGTVLSFALDGAQPDGESRPPQLHARFIAGGQLPESYLYPFHHAIGALPVLEAAAAGNGAMTFVPDADGVVRRVPLVLGLNERPVPSLSTELLRVGQGAQNVILKGDAERATGLQEVRIGELTIPTTQRGEVWLHYTGPRPQRYLPAWKVLAGEIPAAELEGSLVLVGTSAKGLMDLRFSPLGQVIPGVEVHAQALEQILSGDYLARPAWAGAIETLEILVGGLVIGFLALYTGAITSAVIALLMLLGTLGAAWGAFVYAGWLLDPLTPGLVLLATFVFSSGVHHLFSERRQRWVKAAFSRYVSPNLVNYLLLHPAQLELGGKRQTCSFIFTDLVGFTSLMERIDPAEAVSLLNAYLDEMIAIAFRHEGTLDRIVGDAVVIMFSAPIEQPDHCQRAYDCALEMQAWASRYAADVQARGGRFGRTRIGVHTGEVIVGNFGGNTMFDYRALGDPVNTASRLESANRHLGTWICVSEATVAGCTRAVVRPIGQLILKGKSKPLQVFEPLTQGDPPDRDSAYEAAYQLLAEHKPEALAAFRALALSRPGDGLVATHLQRLEMGESNTLIVLSGK
ncbi:MAG: hypothetical protein RIR00_2708 [Pseudomonadota bacterium]|jgi:adenylate cyclase